ncbi:MAG: hypothetical protein JO110_26715 [Acetobacteraceae bacterium]|nr:hypothetical protein [Acetobacteraceae bacterium]
MRYDYGRARPGHLCLSRSQARKSWIACWSRYDTLVPAILIGCLLISAAVHVLFHAGLYIDGSNYLVHLLASRNYFHASPYRINATYLTQFPVILALHSGVRSLPVLTMLYGASLFAVPVVCLGGAIWICRRDALAFAAGIMVIVTYFFTTNFLIIGEFHVQYSTFWLSAVLIFYLGARSILQIVLVLLLAALSVRSYEISLLTGPALAAGCVWRTRNQDRISGRLLLWMAAALFLLGAHVGLQGLLYPRDNNNTHSFEFALVQLFKNRNLLLLAGAVLFASSAVFFRRRAALLSLAAITSGLTLSVMVRALEPHLGDIGIGPQIRQRAQAVPFLLGAFCILVLTRWDLFRYCRDRRTSYPLLLIPVLAMLVLDLRSISEWRVHMASMCEALWNDIPRAGSVFLDEQLTQRFSSSWMLPTMSVLLRPAGSDRIIFDPAYHGWQPFDPATQVPDIEAFKREGGLCPPVQ